MDEHTRDLVERAYALCVEALRVKGGELSPRRVRLLDLREAIWALYMQWRDPQIYARARALRGEIGRRLYHRRRRPRPAWADRRTTWLWGMATAAYQRLLNYRVVWEYPERFVENSPLFHLERVTTPVLILFGDNDGAVPWYQGIEYMLAMRRLGKKAVFLQYKGEAHGLRREWNKKDYDQRVMQWFDHYLKDAKPAKWITDPQN